MILSYEFSQFLQYLCFRCQGIHVFEVKKSNTDIPSELSCSGDLENSGQPPVFQMTELAKPAKSFFSKCDLDSTFIYEVIQQDSSNILRWLYAIFIWL